MSNRADSYFRLFQVTPMHYYGRSLVQF